MTTHLRIVTTEADNRKRYANGRGLTFFASRAKKYTAEQVAAERARYQAIYPDKSFECVEVKCAP